MQKKISLITVKAAKPAANPYFIWDKELKGFGLQVRPNGSISYVLKYLWAGRQKMLSLGQPPAVTPDAARRQAQIAIAGLRRPDAPVEPSAARNALRAKGMTISDLVDQYFNDWRLGHINKKPSAMPAEKSRAKIVKAAVGKHYITQPLDGEALAKRLVRSGHSETYTNRIVAFLSAVYQHGVKLKLVTVNPCRGLSKYRENRMDKFLTAEQMAAIGKAARASTQNAFALSAIRLLFLTGMRKSEVLDLQWRDVDFHQKVLRLRDSKTGAKIVTLSDPALKLLASLPRVKHNHHVFPGRKPGGRFNNLWPVWRKILKAAGVPHFRLHDIRHSVASSAIQDGASLPQVGALLGHKSLRSTERYAHIGETTARQVANKVAGTISKLL